jgi:sugar phosphate isomerase/epimerase
VRLTEPGSSDQRRLAVVAEAFLDRSLTELLDWLADAAPDVTAVELGTGGYAPHPHCDRARLLSDAKARNGWLDEIHTRGFVIAALNAWGNPLHGDRELAARHDQDRWSPGPGGLCVQSGLTASN